MAMDRETGAEITGATEIEQSIDTILGTTPGDRVMRADYGSELFHLTDIGLDAAGTARIAAASAQALRKFEPRLKVLRVTREGGPGEITSTVYGEITTTGERVEARR